MTDYIDLKDITRQHPKLTIIQILAVASECGIRIRNGYVTPITPAEATLLKSKLKKIDPTIKEAKPKPTVPPTQNTSKQEQPKKQQSNIAPKQKKRKKPKPQEPVTYFQEKRYNFPTTPSVPRVRRLRPIKKKEYTVHEECIRKVLVGITLPLTSYDAIKRAVKWAKDRYCLNPYLLVHIYHHLANNPNLQKYFVDNILCRYVETSILTKRNGTEDTYERKLLDIYKKQNNEPALDIMREQEFYLDWNDVTFYYRWIKIDPPRTGNIKFEPLTVSNDMSISELNRLTEYFKIRLPKIRCIAKENKLTLLDEIDLSPAIEYMKVKNLRSTFDPETDGIKRKPIAPQYVMNSFEDALAKADSLDLDRLKSKYINYLSKKQLADYKVIPCAERVTHKSTDIEKLEPAFIFTLPSNRSNKLILAIENLNTARATMLFSFRRMYYDKVLRAIFNYIHSPEDNKRSTLRTWERYGLNGVAIEYRAVNHRSDEHQYSWYDTLRYKISTM